MFDRGALTRTVALRDVHRVEVKRALTNAFRRVLTVRTADEVAVHLEGDQEQVEALARQAAEMAPAGTACLKVESPSILKLAPVALLVVFGALFLLMSLPVAANEGVGTAAIPFRLGAAMLGAGLLLHKKLRQ